MVNTDQVMMIRQAAVLGAGVMGAQIAAHLTNAGIKTVLFDLPSETGSENVIIEQSIKSLSKLKPSPLAVKGIEKNIIAANYSTDLKQLSECDFIIEAIAEKFEFKSSLFEKILPYIADNAILATNTSGLSIEKLAKELPQALQKRFCGVHFFNPPRYMKLVELIPCSLTDTNRLKQLETFIVTRLGKGVVHAKDTPNFIGNRIGVFSLLACLHHAQDLQLSPDVVDALTGPLIGRPKSATFRTMDVVGLDTLKHVVDTLKNGLPDDPWSKYFVLPDWLLGLISRGSLGQKTKEGIYKKSGGQIHVFDIHDKTYRPSGGHIDKAVLSILQEKDPQKKFEQLSTSELPQAQFVWRTFRDLFHYCAYHLGSIAHSVKDIDFAMRWGYGWQQGPFETWQQAGFSSVCDAIMTAVTNKHALASVELPKWCQQVRDKGPYHSGKFFSEQTNEYIERSDLPVYRRQLFPDLLMTEKAPTGDTVFENNSVRMWTLNDRFPILSFKSVMNTIGQEVLEGIQEAIARAEKEYDALILWQSQGDNFSVGANLKQVMEFAGTGDFKRVEQFVKDFQQTAMALRYAKIPTIAAIKGFTFGGGCELSMHATRIVAAFETYMGLVESGVGLIPAGGGTKELALRASQEAFDGDLFTPLKGYFEQIAMGQVAQSALDARRLHYLQPQDSVIFNADELLFMAKKQAAMLADLAYAPPVSKTFPVAGKPAIANFKTQIINLHEGEFISEHDALIASVIANVISGGELDAGSYVDEDWMLALEREGILMLAQTTKTRERIKYMLEKGKPLRN